MVSYLLYVIFVYIISSLLGYLAHQSFHQHWMGFVAKAHWVHHTVMYPPEDLISPKYRHAGKNSTILLFLPLVLTVVGSTIGLGYFHILSLSYTLTAIVIVIGFSLMSNALHDAFHVEKSVWHRVPGFAKMRERHFNHHVDVTINFGIFDFTWDRIFRTFRN